MISAENLTKSFGTRRAVDGISFEIARGQVVGFLGPNGAGKTTTMRMLTAFLPADEGRARIEDIDVAERPLEARRRLGYLPEDNPLYEDLEVTETLELTAALRGLEGAHRRERIAYALKACGLKAVVGRKAGELSKGYRQRLGLAQAILHDPEVLILDEPTAGLDPNQVREVRDLIGELRREKTMLISTHILPEATVLCDRLVIINSGRVIANGTPGEIETVSQGRRRLYVEMKAPAQDVGEALKSLAGVSTAVPASPADGFWIGAADDKDPREAIFRLAVARNWPILELRWDKPNLEEVFRRLTQES